MSFLRAKKTTLGPRGRGAALGYVPDDAAFSSGPGAIAAIDGATQRRRQARARGARLSERRDQRMARMTMGAVPLAVAAARSSPVVIKHLASMLPGEISKFIMPGMAIGSPVRPGTVNVGKYPQSGMPTLMARGGVVGGARLPNAPVLPVFRAPIMSVPPGGLQSIAVPAVPASTITTPVATDPSSGGGGGGSSTDPSTPAPTDDGSAAVDTSALDPTDPTTDPTLIPAVPIATPSTMPSTQTMLVAGAAAFAAWWFLFRKPKR